MKIKECAYFSNETLIGTPAENCNLFPETSTLKLTFIECEQVAISKCPYCGNYVGCHPNTTKTLGCIPTNELKKARIKVHDKLDYLWKSGKYKRAKIYKTLSEHFGYRYHNGNTKSVEECMKAIEILDKYYIGAE